MDIVGILKMLVLSDAAFGTILCLIAANFIVAVLGAWQRREFDWSFVADVFGRDILPKCGGYLVLRVIMANIPDGDLLGQFGFGALAATAYGVIVGELASRIMAHLRELGLIGSGDATG